MRINIKPLSVNAAWMGRRFKTPAYTNYERECIGLLPNFNVTNGVPLRVAITFGFSSRASDIDNGLKPILDILQKRYGFNDKDIQELNVRKELVTKGNEFIDIGIEEMINK